MIIFYGDNTWCCYCSGPSEKCVTGLNIDLILLLPRKLAKKPFIHNGGAPGSTTGKLALVTVFGEGQNTRWIVKKMHQHNHRRSHLDKMRFLRGPPELTEKQWVIFTILFQRFRWKKVWLVVEKVWKESLLSSEKEDYIIFPLSLIWF